MSGIRSISLRNSPPPATILVRRRAPKPTSVYDTYWRFAVERQAIYHRRVRGEPQPWTHDRILSIYKFTNAYRAADRVSQYLIQRVIYAGSHSPLSTVFRILLFKFFNKTETWELINETIGDITERSFSVTDVDRVLSAASASGSSIYSAAYIMPSGPRSIRLPRKHRMHLMLLASLLKDRVLQRLAKASSLNSIYSLLRSVPSIGPFLAYQFAIDLNYSPHFDHSEMEFVVPGPGALGGIKKCFSDLGDYTEAEVIRWVTDRQEEEFSRRNLEFESLWGRPLQLIDCQNLFCEVDKYARVAHPEIVGDSGRVRIKQKFSSHGELLRPWFPPKWGLNECFS